MRRPDETPGPGGAADEEIRLAELQYIGKMAASVSHELRNNLATINEKNGLISDMAELAARGRPLSEARIGALSSDIARRIKMATEVCERLSRLSHSPDLPQQVVEATSQVELVCGLMERLARISSKTLEIDSDLSVNIETDPVLLQLAISTGIDWMLQHGLDDLVHLSVERRGRDAVDIVFRRAEWGGLLEANPQLQHALTMLGASIELDPSEGEARFVIPTKHQEKSHETTHSAASGGLRGGES